MSMDDQLARLERFHRDLRAFHERLSIAARELASAHDRLAPLWKDSFRRDYDALYQPLAQQLERYRAREAPAFELFLREKSAALRRYLLGS